eukprot:519071-Prorocentrum_minimum.AAC.1
MAWKEPSLVAWTDMLERLWKHDLDEHRLEGSSHDKETREKNKKLLRNILKERGRRDTSSIDKETLRKNEKLLRDILKERGRRDTSSLVDEKTMKRNQKLLRDILLSEL